MEKNLVLVQSKVPFDVREKIKNLADRRGGLSVADFVRIILYEYLAKEGENAV